MFYLVNGSPLIGHSGGPIPALPYPKPWQRILTTFRANRYILDFRSGCFLAELLEREVGTHGVPHRILR